MRLDEWIDITATHEALKRFVEPISGKNSWANIANEAKPVLLSALLRKNPVRAVLIAPTHERAVHWQARLSLCGLPPASIAFLPSSVGTLFEDAAPEAGVLSDRLGALMKLASGEPVCVIASIGSALERTLPAEQLRKAAFSIRLGDDINPDSFMRRLVGIGYDIQEPVRLPGQCAKRGGIVDVYPMSAPFPIRIEWFGDTIDSMREFDPMSQRSLKEISEIAIPPGRETLLPDKKEALAIIQMLKKRCSEALNTAEADIRDTLNDRIAGDITGIENGAYFDRLDLYRPMTAPTFTTVLDYLGDDGLVVLDDPLDLGGHAERAVDDVRHLIESRVRRGEMLSADSSDYIRSVELFSNVKNSLSLNSMDADVEWYSPINRIDVNANSLASYRGQALALVEAMKNWQSKGVKLAVGTDQPVRAAQMLNELNINASETEGSGAMMVRGNLAGGFIMPDAGMALITDAELFGVGRLRLPAKRVHEGVPIASLLDLKPGDYVVHIYHGVGLFRGLVKMPRDGVEKEYLLVEYAAPDRLYVPVEQIDRIQKYLAPGEEKPSLHRLGGTDWIKAVKTAREGARELAGELARLYGARQKATRTPYSPDTPWQQELESAFPFVETPSQALAIYDVKSDMQKHQPMDRLVCGDVGFGKTEVAVRAAFKAVQDGKQVAVLCPTTILAAQHFETFSERLAPYPIKVALLNRFRTPKQQKETIARLADGSVDVVIGTHRLLSKDVVFKSFGLLIIDEEQRFGVAHKEKLKQLKTHVDALTLTATPIPRTLYMALMDIREMSVINDPPPGRLAIRTYVRAWDDETVRDACLRELQRDGQIYIVHNRVESIYHVADHVSRLVPHARIAVGHGQMDEKELEAVMLDFHAGKYDILVCTTIIENGLDIPNVNTIIVDQAHKLGLAQLYQLRGRVGRSDRQAYAYMLYRTGKKLGTTAFERMAALREFSELGSGFSLAMRDMQIRGAGELLGARQHGAMAGVGFELYMQLISEAVHEIQGSAPEQDIFVNLPAVDLPVSAMIPIEYIEDSNQRLFIYKRIGGLTSENAINDLLKELKDRYGEPPKAVYTAIRIVRLRMLCRECKVDKLEGKGGKLFIRLMRDNTLKQSSIFHLQTVFKGSRFHPEGGELTRLQDDIIELSSEVVRAIGESLHRQASLFAKS